MSADEMFEELGYEIAKEVSEKKINMVAVFNLKKKCFLKQNI